MESPTQKDEHGQPLMTHYTVYPVDLWVAPDQREPLCKHLEGRWLTCDEALAEPRLSPTARKVFEALKKRHEDFQEKPPDPEKEKRNALQAEALAPSLQPGLRPRQHGRPGQGVARATTCTACGT